MTHSHDYLRFLAHSLEVETEAGERYGELADAMAEHNNPQVAAFFHRMANEAALHRAEVAELAEGAPLPRIAPWEFEWPEAEPPETASYEALHYRMGLREAMQLALQNENSARAWYLSMAEGSEDPQTVATALRFAEEEAGHAAALERMLAELPQEPQLRRQEDDEPNMPE